MLLAIQKSTGQPDTTNVDPAARAQAAQAVRELVARYAISESDLRKVLDEVEREREKQAAIQTRQAELEHRRARERAAHVARQLVEFWRIESSELATIPRVSRRAAQPAIKYRHPVTGESWDGAGAQPEWLRRALGTEGYRVAELQPCGGDCMPGTPRS